MAKLLSYYRLCPLIDSKSLLGISDDEEKGVVLVTLGKNIVIKYRLLDQKQICSWRTRDKFSSQVLYDKKQQKYVGVFNKSFIRLWTGEDENLDKIKKIKFINQIYTIFIHNDETYIFFKDGSVYPLTEILENGKSFVPEKNIESADIYDVLYTTIENILYFGYLVKREEDYTFYWSSYTTGSRNNFNSLHIKRDELELHGYGLHIEGDSVNFLSVWSDGRIYVQPLKDVAKNSTNPGELFMVLDNISAQHLVKIVDIDENYIAVYGADPNEEGATLLIYNTQFKVNQSKQNHKLYTNDSKIWRIDNNIFLPVGQNLIVVPFCLESEQLAALVGSHKPLLDKSDADIMFVADCEIGNWKLNKPKLIQFNHVKAKNLTVSLKEKVEEYIKQGLPESLIVEQIFPEILEGNKIQLFRDSLNFFIDIPEKYIVSSINFILSCDKQHFITENASNKFTNVPEELLPASRIILLDQILLKKYSDVIILPYLQSDLSIENALLLLRYLIFLLSEDGHNLSKIKPIIVEKCIINWASLLIDSNYQKFVLSKDGNIEKVLRDCKNIILNYLEVVDEIKKISPILFKLKEDIEGKTYNSGFTDNVYGVEQLSLY